MVSLLGVAHGDCELAHGGRWKPRVEAALSWNLGLYPLSNVNQRFSPGNRAQIVGYGSADPQEMAEYQEMRSIGHHTAGHAAGPNPKSRLEYESSPRDPRTREYRTIRNGGIPTAEARRPFRGRTCIRTESEIEART